MPSMVCSSQLCALRLKYVKTSRNQGLNSYCNPNDKVHFPASMSPTCMRGSIIVHCSWEAHTSAESVSAMASPQRKIYIHSSVIRSDHRRLFFGSSHFMFAFFESLSTANGRETSTQTVYGREMTAALNSPTNEQNNLYVDKYKYKNMEKIANGCVDFRRHQHEYRGQSFDPCFRNVPIHRLRHNLYGKWFYYTNKLFLLSA